MAFRDFILRILPASWRAAAEADSRLWLAECPKCGVKTSIWDHGGVRWNASGTKHSRLRCPACGKVSWQRIAKDG